ncbi:hypothetical protein Cenrod_0733 [Candidatus Symbiobacter mobilis CR]|uniref:Uncharacterized protein n=1 Tax=Candidatus Symbiobacter mobilis CR TaxID=946483 RepID=U5N6E6_9BURK|nr:hypothetical protein Cenrod_0733 [Candidatus Symbiobacter mobilis CR]
MHGIGTQGADIGADAGIEQSGNGGHGVQYVAKLASHGSRWDRVLRQPMIRTTLAFFPWSSPFTPGSPIRP